MAVTWNFQDTMHTRLDSTARTAREYEPGGTVLIRERPFTSAENAIADAAAAREAEATNQATIEVALLDALATLQVIIEDSNSNINANPAARIKDLAKVLRRVIRLVIRRFDGTT